MSDRIDRLLCQNEDAIDKVREYYNKSKDELKCDIDILKEWMRQQPHLPDEDDDNWLERILLCNKCRIEETKIRLEKIYTFRSMYKEFLDFYSLENGKLKEAMKYYKVVPLPKMTDKLERIVYFQSIILPDMSLDHFYSLPAFCEMLRAYDSSVKYIYLVDMTNISFEYISMFSLPFFTKMADIGLNALNLSFSHAIYYKGPSYINAILQMLKLLIKPKLMQRIRVYQTIESFEHFLPKELLPIELGGQNGSVNELYKETCECMLEKPKFFAELAKKRSDESLRTEPLKINELFGVEGTFKTLNLD